MKAKLEAIANVAVILVAVAMGCVVLEVGCHSSIKNQECRMKMKTLRLVRNIAVLFILIMALLAWRPGVGVSHAASGKGCFPKLGYSCTYTTNNGGNCQEHPCQKGESCFDSGCVSLKTGF